MFFAASATMITPLLRYIHMAARRAAIDTDDCLRLRHTLRHYAH